MKSILALLFACACLVVAAEEAAATAPAVSHPYFAANVKALVGADGKKIAQERLLKNPYILVYFSAHWCPPCRAFTPDLVKYYNENGGGKTFEILFVSADEDAAKMLGYMKEAAMPWVGLNFGSTKKGELNKKYGGDGIPCLTVVDDKDQVVFHSYVDGKYVGPRQVLAQFSELMKPKK